MIENLTFKLLKSTSILWWRLIIVCSAQYFLAIHNHYSFSKHILNMCICMTYINSGMKIVSIKIVSICRGLTIMSTYLFSEDTRTVQFQYPHECHFLYAQNGAIYYRTKNNFTCTPGTKKFKKLSCLVLLCS